MKKYIVWGAGTIGKALISYLNKKSIPVECIVDGSNKKWNNDIENIKILNPEEVFKHKTSCIVVIAAGGKYISEIKAQLKQYGILEDDILLYYDVIKFDNTGSNMGFGVVSGYLPHSVDTVLLKSTYKDKILEYTKDGEQELIVHQENKKTIEQICNVIKDINSSRKIIRDILIKSNTPKKYYLEKVSLYSYASEWSPEMFKQMCSFYADFLGMCVSHNITLYSLSYDDIIFHNGGFLYNDILNLVPGRLSFELIECFVNKFVSILLLMKSNEYDRAFLFINNDLPNMNIKDVCGYVSDEELDGYHVLLEKISEYYMCSDIEKIFGCLKDYIENIQLKERDVYQWDSYQNSEFDSLMDRNKWSDKQKKVIDLITQTDAKNMIDLAGNMGWYCVAMKDSMDYAVVADIDYNCIDFSYKYIRENNISNIYPIQINMVTPPLATYKYTPIGYSGIEPWKKDAVSRYKSDLVVALAIIHHLAFSQQLSFDEIINQVSLFSNKWLLIEFVHREDDYMLEYLKSNSQFDWYTQANFEEALGKKFEIISRENTSTTRTAYLCRLK